MTAPEHPASAAGRAREAAEGARWAEAAAWALVSIAEDVAVIRRDLHWQRQNIRSDARRG